MCYATLCFRHKTHNLYVIIIYIIFFQVFVEKSIFVISYNKFVLCINCIQISIIKYYIRDVKHWNIFFFYIDDIFYRYICFFTVCYWRLEYYYISLDILYSRIYCLFYFEYNLNIENRRRRRRKSDRARYIVKKDYRSRQ